jgi:hypothetical protein
MFKKLFGFFIKTIKLNWLADTGDVNNKVIWIEDDFLNLNLISLVHCEENYRTAIIVFNVSAIFCSLL